MLAILTLFACSNSGLGEGSVNLTDPAEVRDDCPWVGEWDLRDVACGDTAYAAWFATFTEARLDIEADPDGGCRVDRELIADGCRETEGMHWFAVGSQGAVEATSLGVSRCVPGGCAFTSVGYCALDDRLDDVDTLTVTLASEPDEVLSVADARPAGTFQDRLPVPVEGATCQLDIVTTWVRR